VRVMACTDSRIASRQRFWQTDGNMHVDGVQFKVLHACFASAVMNLSR
jgi:hypothetical protein